MANIDANAGDGDGGGGGVVDDDEGAARAVGRVNESIIQLLWL